MDETTEKVRELICPLFEGGHFFLVDLEIRGRTGSQVVSVYADTLEGITLDEITGLTREINDLLDMHNVIPGSYRLDVSSPGVDRPLTASWEFEKNIGRNLRVIFKEDAGEKEVSGRLESVTEETLLLMVKNKEVAIPRDSIVKARVQLKW
jgi:ribosome maturation factor RimP